MRPHGSDLDAALDGDLGKRLARHDADGGIGLRRREAERLRQEQAGIATAETGEPRVTEVTILPTEAAPPKPEGT